MTKRHFDYDLTKRQVIIKMNKFNMFITAVCVLLLIKHMKVLLNVNKNAKVVIESELRANVRFLALMNASSRYWSSIHANVCVFPRNEQQKV